MYKNLLLLFLITLCFQIKTVGQTHSCSGYEILKDSIGTPFIMEGFFLQEVGVKQNDKSIGLPPDRLLQYPFFTLFVDKRNLFSNYSTGFFSFVDAFTPLKDSLKTRGILFTDGLHLKKKFNLFQPVDTFYQNITFKRKGNYRNIKRLFFVYKLYQLKLSVIYIGRYCRKIPYRNIGKNQPLFLDSSLDVYVILNILE